MVNVGIVGLGFIGMIHYLGYKKVRGAKVRAICEKDPKRLAGDWRTITGNFGPKGQKTDLTGVAQYPEIDDLLADPRIDMVDICLTNEWHTDIAVRALNAGKHVLCEKPIATKTADAERMVRTAEKCGKMLMIAHVLPFFTEYQFAYKAVTGGQYGALRGDGAVRPMAFVVDRAGKIVWTGEGAAALTEEALVAAFRRVVR